MELEEVDCYMCKSGDSEFFLEENGFSLVKCKECGFLYIRKRPVDEQISAATRMGQHKGDKDLDANVRYNPAVKSFYRSVVSDIFRNEEIEEGSWLDVGCGYGEWIETIGERFPNIKCKGIEPNEVKSKSAKERGLDVISDDLWSLDGSFEFVSLLNVFSHLPNPAEFIERLMELVKPGGRLILQTGDVSDLGPDKILTPLCLPDHLCFASESILRKFFVSKLGCENIEAFKYPNLSATPLGILKEMVKVIFPNHSSMFRHYLNYQIHKEGRMFLVVEKP